MLVDRLDLGAKERSTCTERGGPNNEDVHQTIVTVLSLGSIRDQELGPTN